MMQKLKDVCQKYNIKMATTKTNQTWAEQLASMLNKAATDIGEFQVQLALGKAEARDEYEKLKKDLRKQFSSSSPAYQAGKKQAAKIEGGLDELRVQLALGKADTIDAFNFQKKKITSALNKLDTALAALPHDDKFKMAAKSEIEKTKIKLDILRLHYRFTQMTAEETAKRVGELKQRVKEIKDNAVLTEELGKVEREIESGYNHLKKTFS